MARWCIGIDLGGTLIKFGALDESRHPGGMLQLPTPTDGAEPVIAQMVLGAQRVMGLLAIGQDELVGVGIGAPGPLDISAGIVRAMPNIPGMENVPLRERICSALGARAVLENDANAAAFAEYLCGAGEETQNIVLLTLGTGIGSGVVIDGRILHGDHDIGAELGHMIVEPDGEKCGCGQRGCLERYCSATYMGAYAEHRIQVDGEQSLLGEVLTKSGAISAKDVNEARKAGDDLAAEVWGRGAYYLALGCVNICRIFDPGRIVLTGGMTNAGDDLMVPVREFFGSLHWLLTEPTTEIVLSRLGSDGGVIGAAAVAWDTFGQ